MADGIYVALSGALGRSRELDVVANNLSNLETPGFKESGVAFSTAMKRVTMDEPGPDGIRWLPMDKDHMEVVQSYARLAKGPLIRTDNPLDLAVEQDAYFQVLTPQGAMASPGGSFRLDPSGRLVDASGAPLLDRSGSPVRVVPEGDVVVTEEGQVLSDGKPVANLALVKAAGPLQQVGAGHLQGRTVPVSGAKVRVLQGWIERSNVDPMRALVGLIRVHRGFEALQNVIRTYRQMDGIASTQVGKTTG